MYMRRYIIILFTLLLMGCKGNTGRGLAGFRIEKEVSIHKVGEPLVSGVPVDLCVEGNYLFVLAYTPDKWLHIYDRNTGQKILDAINVGRGPGEAVSIVSMDYCRDEHTLYLYDAALRKTLVIVLDGESANASFIQEVQHPMEGVIRNCHVLSGHRFFYEGYLPEYGKETRFTLSNGEMVLDAYSDYPGINNEDDQIAFILGVSKADYSSGRFVSGTTFGAVLECFDVSGTEIKPIATRILDLPEMDLSGRAIKMKEGKKYGFSTICLTKELIYTCYLDNRDPTVFKTIASFDWRGREHTLYKMDQNILRLCPGDNGDGIFYGISSSSEMEFSLVWFVLD